MRRYVKASSAGSTRGIGSAGTRQPACALATRGSSLDFDGSGARSTRLRGPLSLLLAFGFVLALALAPTASASKGVVGFFGNPSTSAATSGGLFATPGGVAVNSNPSSSSNGNIYVADRSNNRIQEFDAAGNFLRAWGQDVQGRNEQQTLAVSATGGTYKLTVGASTTGAIAYNAAQSAIQTALAGLASVGAGNVTVTGNLTTGYTITFTGAKAGTDMPQIVPDSSGLTGGSATATAATTVEGAGGATTGFEICTQANICKAGITTANPSTGGQMNAPQNIAIDQTDGAVYVTDQGGIRVQKFDENGNFLRAFGKDVVTGGVTTTEICTVATQCKVGVTGAAGGEFATTFSGGIAVNQANRHVVVADAGNRRLQEFTLSGSFVRAWGWNVTATVSEQQQVTVNATGGTFSLTFKGETTGAAGSGNLTIGSPEVTGVLTSSGTFTAGEAISGTGIPAGTTILAVGAGTLTLSANATAEGTGVALTANIPFNATAATVQAALQALPSIGAGNATVTGAAGGPWTVTFAGTLAGENQPLMTAGNAGLTGGTASVTVSTTVDGGGADATFEVCTVASQCTAGLAGSGVGQFAAGQPARLAVGASNAIYAVEAATNFRVQKFTPAGATLTPSVFAESVLSGGSASPPVDIAADPTTGRVFVVKAYPVGASTCPDGSPSIAERRILEFDADGSVPPVDTHMSCAGINAVNGLAVDTTTKRLYMSSNTLAQRIYLVDLVAAPTATLGTASLAPVTGIGPHQATFNATVNSHGGPSTGYHFEYSKDGTNWTKLPGTDVVVAGDSSDHEVTQTTAANALEANQTYHLRIVATKPFGGPIVVSGGEDFTTLAEAPTVITLPASPVTATSAILRGTINPNNQATSYRFEFGPTSSYGTVLGASTADLTGATTIEVSVPVGGLEPEHEYHFRIVAANANGEIAGADRSIFTDPSMLSGGRHYELVSPPEKHGVPPISEYQSPDGNAIEMATTVPLPDTETQSNHITNLYLARRGSTGWKTLSVSPEKGLPRAVSTTAIFPSADLSTNVVLGATVSGIAQHQTGIYLVTERGVTAPLLGPSQTPLVPTQVWDPESGGTDFDLLASTADFSHVLLKSINLQLLGFEPRPTAGSPGNLYEIVGGTPATRTLRLVARADGPSGAIIGGVCGAAYPANRDRAISIDGERIIFTARPGAPASGTAVCESFPARIYARTGGSETAEISASECSPACGGPTGSDEFKAASADGKRVFFTTARQLVNGDTDSTNDLYLYDFSASPGSRLTQVSAGSAGAVVQDSFFQVSPDGTHVYFVAKGNLTANPNPLGEVAGGTANKLYLYERDAAHPSGRLAFVGTRAAEDESGAQFGIAAHVQAVPYGGSQEGFGDGHILVFSSKMQLTGDDHDAVTDIFRYDSAAGTLIRISKSRNGFGSDGNEEGMDASLEQAGVSSSGDSMRSRVVTEDGQTVVFQTKEALQGGDTNGLSDAYEWHEGEISRITDGRTEESTTPLPSITPSGNQITFHTDAQLVAADRDRTTDVYVARTGADFPITEEDAVKTCIGDACQGPLTPPPAVPGIGSKAVSGSGNANPKPTLRCRKGTHRVKRQGKVRCVKTRHRKHANKGTRQASARRATAPASWRNGR